MLLTVSVGSSWKYEADLRTRYQFCDQLGCVSTCMMAEVHGWDINVQHCLMCVDWIGM